MPPRPGGVGVHGSSLRARRSIASAGIRQRPFSPRRVAGSAPMRIRNATRARVRLRASAACWLDTNRGSVCVSIPAPIGATLSACLTFAYRTLMTCLSQSRTICFSRRRTTRSGSGASSGILRSISSGKERDAKADRKSFCPRSRSVERRSTGGSRATR